jgi:hypothetical protein
MNEYGGKQGGPPPSLLPPPSSLSSSPMTAIHRPLLLLSARSIYCSIGSVNSLHLCSSASTIRSRRLHPFNRLFSANINADIDVQNNLSIQDNRISAAILRRSDGQTALDPIEDAVTACLTHYENEAPLSIFPGPMNIDDNILQYPEKDRESIGVASNLQKILDSFGRSGVHCRRCWLQKKHCICETCADLGSIPGVNRLFVLVS